MLFFTFDNMIPELIVHPVFYQNVAYDPSSSLNLKYNFLHFQIHTILFITFFASFLPCWFLLEGVFKENGMYQTMQLMI